MLKFFFVNERTNRPDKQTGQKLYAPDLWTWGHKKEMTFGILRDKFKLKKFQSLYFVFEYWFGDIKG